MIEKTPSRGAFQSKEHALIGAVLHDIGKSKIPKLYYLAYLPELGKSKIDDFQIKLFVQFVMSFGKDSTSNYKRSFSSVEDYKFYSLADICLLDNNHTSVYFSAQF